MKNISFIILICLGATQLNAQVKSCCNMNAASEFAMLGKNADFRDAHLSPEPFKFIPSRGSNITFPTTDGKEGKAFFVKSETKSDKYLFVFQEWWGLNDYIRKEAERFASEMPGVNVMALDLYDGKIATNADEASKLMQAMSQDRGVAIINGAAQYAGANAKIQTVGWCFGGAWSLQAAIILGNKVTACVMYYGMPEKDPARLKMLKAPVLGIFASQDNHITKEIVNNFEMQMKELKKPVTIKFYEADHAFANPSNPKYNKEYAEEAHAIALEFLNTNKQ